MIIEMIILSAFITYTLCLLYSYYNNKKIKLQKKIKEEHKQEQIGEDEEKRKTRDEWEKYITGKCEPIKLSFYDNYNLDYKMTDLYEKVIRNNLWINEPFHSKFYEFLMLINDNNFMIIDPYSKVITMKVRDKHNKMQTSKSYQVYSSRDVIRQAITYCMSDITRFNKKDGQNLVISIFVLVLKRSVHYLSKEIPQNIIDKIFQGYEEAQAIKNIIQMIEAKNEKVYFIQESIYNAFSLVETLPYNDSEVIKSFEIRQELPKKLLQTI